MKLLSSSVCASFLFATAATAQQPPTDWTRYAEPARLVDVGGGRRINIDCRGSGLPVVLLEPGFGGSSLSWASVHDSLAKLTTTCAYDRAGLGRSDPRHEQISLDAVAEDARGALHQAGLEGPFVLVGASMGGIFARQFAAQYPDETAGLVLLDPGGPELQAGRAEIDPEAKRDADTQVANMLEACVAAARSGELRTSPEEYPVCVASPDPSWPSSLRDADQALQTSPSFAEARLAEFTLDDRTLSPQAREPFALGDRPLVILSADNGLSRAIPEPNRSRLIASRMAVDAALARLSTRGVHEVVAESSHAIDDDHPEAVIAAVAKVVDAVRLAVDQDK